MLDLEYISIWYYCRDVAKGSLIQFCIKLGFDKSISCVKSVNWPAGSLSCSTKAVSNTV